MNFWRFKILPLTTAVLLSALLPRHALSETAVPPINTVFFILEENQNWSDITPDTMPYLMNRLVPIGAHATRYFNPPGLHPSQPNYIWLEAGDNLGITDNAHPAINHCSTPDHLVRYLENAGISWKSYQEDISGTVCPLTPVNKYVPRHNPMVYFDDVTENNNPNSAKCISHIRPYSELEADLLNNTVARYNFITPNMCNDMHDCGPLAGDKWLSREVPKILNSEAFKNGGVLFITWDEGQNLSDGPIGMVVVSPYARRGYSNSILYNHSSTVRTMQEIFGVKPLLGGAKDSPSLADLFVSDYSFDTAGPSVYIASPLPGESVSGAVTVTAAATDDIGVTKAELFVDQKLVESRRFPPYIFTWNTAKQKLGEHEFSVKAYDAAKHVTVSVPFPISVVSAK